MQGLGVWMLEVDSLTQNLVQSLSCVTLGEVLDLSMAQFPYKMRVLKHLLQRVVLWID